MKPFDELSDAELVDLTDDQIKYYVDLACAEDGVKLVPPNPPQPPTKPAPEPDVTAYQIVGLLVTDMHEAERVRDLVASLKTRGKDGYGYPKYRNFFKPLEPSDAPTITPVKMLSEAKADKFKVELDEHKAQAESYEKAQQEYEKAVLGRDRVAESIYKTLREARDREYRRLDLRSLFDRYVEIAKGDRAMAWAFLTRVERDASQMLPALAEEFDGPVVMPGPPPEPVAIDDIPY